MKVKDKYLEFLFKKQMGRLKLGRLKSSLQPDESRGSLLPWWNECRIFEWWLQFCIWSI